MVAGLNVVTAEGIISDALQRLRIYDSDETVSDTDAQTCLNALNDMVDSWATESLSCFCILEQSFPLVVGQGAYTIGLSGGADIAATRPIRLITGPGAAYLLDSNNNRYGINVIPRDQFNLIGTTTTTSNLPDTMFYDPQIPLGVINIWPIPSIGYQCFFDSYQQLVGFPDLTTQIDLPPGYPRALKLNAAIEFKTYFNAAQLAPEVVQRAAEAKANMKRANLRPSRAVYDPEIVARAAGTYNIYRDSGSATTD